MDKTQIKMIAEGALLAAGKALTVDQIAALFEDHERPERDEIREILKELESDMQGRGIELKRVASGYRLQVRTELSRWVSRLWDDKPPRYSRAFLETLALIAYRQPITRGEIENIRGVSVSSNIIRTMLDREWIKVVGHRDVPGKPALYSTTKAFLDSFNLRNLEELPPLSEIRDLSDIGRELEPEASVDADVLDGTIPQIELALPETNEEFKDEYEADSDDDFPAASVDALLTTGDVKVDDARQSRDAGSEPEVKASDINREPAVENS